MRFDFIEQVRQEQPWSKVTLLCRALEVSCSGYAAWRKRQRQPSSPRQQDQARLVLHIRAAHRRGRCYYGSPKVHRDLREQGICVSRQRVARLMRQGHPLGRAARALPETAYRMHNGFAACATGRT